MTPSHLRTHGLNTSQYRKKYPHSVYVDPEYKKSMITTQCSKARNIAIRELWEDPDFVAMRKKSASDQFLGYWGDPSYQDKMGRITSARNLESWKNEEYRKKMSGILKEQSILGIARSTERIVAFNQDSEFCRKRDLALSRRKWRPPSSPNQQESVVSRLSPPCVQYVGDGSLWLTSNGIHLNPDFLVTGQKKVIEFYGSHWHPGGEAEANARIQLFRDIGWDCLVVWDTELLDKRDVATKIEKFVTLH